MYVYILESTEGNHYYTGVTEKISQRLEKHNAGEVPHTAKYKPWKLRSYSWFENRDRAHAFERYLKSGSGRVFAERHF